MYNIYQCNDDDSARFLLGKNGNRKLFIIGLNPSVANKEKSDTTVAKAEKVAINNCFEGFVMANLYPLRSTDPKILPAMPNETLFNTNLQIIIAYATNEQEPVFWAAWGGGITLRTYLIESLKALADEVNYIGATWVNFGKLCKDGHPRHPSRLSYNWQFKNFDTTIYLQKFSKHI